ncbi:MAG TPA: hypothetical protein VH518_00295 [Tepidisphaeraceae bacterium]
MKWASWTWTTGLLVLSLAAALLGAGPATSEPSRITSQIRTWLDQLADKDADVRDQATQQLLGLRREDLPALLDAVAQTRPLRPSQMSPLRDIVRHVFISGIKYAPEPRGTPFLGLSWPPEVPDESPPDEPGVPVYRRIPGFPAYEMLREGDLLLGIDAGDQATVTNSRKLFTDMIATCKAGQTVKLLVARQGKTITVPVQLRPKPAALSTVDSLDAWIDEQTQAADVYWEQSFAPLMTDSVS